MIAVSDKNWHTTHLKDKSHGLTDRPEGQEEPERKKKKTTTTTHVQRKWVGQRRGLCPTHLLDVNLFNTVLVTGVRGKTFSICFFHWTRHKLKNGNVETFAKHKTRFVLFRKCSNRSLFHQWPWRTNMKPVSREKRCQWKQSSLESASLRRLLFFIKVGFIH